MTERDKYILRLLDADVVNLRLMLTETNTLARAMRDLGIGGRKRNVFDEHAATIESALTQTQYRNDEILQYFKDRVFANSQEYEQAGWIVTHYGGQTIFKSAQQNGHLAINLAGNAPEVGKGGTVVACYVVMK